MKAIHKAMSYGRLKEQEAALSAEIDALIEQAARCDQEEDKTYQERTGYELPEDLKHKQGRLAKIKAAKKALEQREEQIYPGQAIEESKQISFADTESRIMGKKRSRLRLQCPDQRGCDLQIIVAQHISQNANDQQEVEPALEACKRPLTDCRSN